MAVSGGKLKKLIYWATPSPMSIEPMYRKPKEKVEEAKKELQDLVNQRTQEVFLAMAILN